MLAIIILFVVFVMNSAFAVSDEIWTKYSTGSKSTDGIVTISIENNYIWCGTSGGLVRWNSLDKSYVRFFPGDNPADCSVTALAIDSKGIKWLGVISDIYTGGSGFNWSGRDGCIYSFEDSTWLKYEKELFSEVSDNKIDFRIDTIVFDNMDRIIVEYYYNIYKNKYQTDTTHYISMYDGTSWNNFFSIAYSTFVDLEIMIDTSDKNVLWESEWYNLRSFNLTDMTKKTMIMDAGGDLSMSIDNDNNIWLGSRGSSIIKYDRKSFTYFYPSTSGVAGGIYSIAIDKHNYKWFGSHAGITRFDGMSWKTYAPEGWVVDFDAGNKNACIVFDLKFDSNGSLWVGTNKGLYRFDSDPVSVQDSVPQSTIMIDHATPNPFNATTAISFTLPATGRTTLAVYSITGQRIRTLISGPMAAGTHTAAWDGRDDSGHMVSSGVYMARLVSGKSAVSRKLLLMK